MFKSYLIIALRNLRRNKTFSLINMAGLVLGMSVFLLILEFVTSEWNTNRFQKNYSTLYRVAITHKEGGTDYYTPPGYGILLKKNIIIVRG